MKKLIAIILSIFILISTTTGQDDECNKTIVGVSVEIVEGTRTPEFLEKDFGSGNITDWNGFVTHMLVQILTEFEPEITFYSLEEIGEDCHYFFRANLDLGILRDENYEFTGQTGYYIIAGLRANANCVPNRNWVLDIYDAIDPDLKQAMKNMVSQFYPMDRNIVSYEIKHPSPPRDPKLIIKFEKEYVSPLDKESRKTKVDAKVYDCRGKLVCDDKEKGQPVYYQDYLDRLDLKKTNMGEGGYHLGNYMVIVGNKYCKCEGEYRLEKGLKAEKKKIRFKTCSLGGPIDDYALEEKELIIRGLEIEVLPERNPLKQDEQTRIVITFNETDPDGSRYPVVGKELDVKINGISNGKITPQSGYTTNSEGKVILGYKAGSNDEKIRVTASYQPVDYPDKVTGSGSVSVIPDNYAWSGSIDLEITQIFNCDVEEPTGELSTKRILAGDHKTTYASISIGLSDFNLPATGTSAGAKLQYISGQVTVIMNEKHTIEGSSAKTQCHNDGTGRWEWVAPGNWNTWNETKTGQAYADIEDGGITLLIAKEMLADKKAADNAQQQMAEMQAKLLDAYNSMDKQAMEKIKGEMRNMVQGDQNDAIIPVTAALNISFGVKNYPVYTSYDRKVYNVCTGEFEENESNSETVEMPLMLPIGAKMKGEYTRGRNGNDRIELSIKETMPYHPTFGSGTSCPEGTITVNGNITLERRREK